MDCPRCESELDRDSLNEPILYEGTEQILCDTCTLATLILQYTHADPPYVDIGLYQEVVFYARQLAAESVPDAPEEIVNQPENPDAESDNN